MFRHKFHRTFIAMFWGWGVFTLCFPFLAWLACQVEGRSTHQIAGTWIAFAIYSIPVILAAWLLILLPVDCVVPETSYLRRPLPAAGMGALCGLLPFFLLGTYDQMTDISSWCSEVLRSAKDADSWLYLGGAAITGLTAALHVVIKHPREIKPAPLKT